MGAAIRMLVAALAILTCLANLQAADRPEVGTVDPATQKLQEEFLTWKFGLFLHFNIATFTDREWANGYEDPALFKPAKLDCGQWADAAKTAGMKYAVLTVKHTEGYCLWPSKHTSHDIRQFTNYKGGKGDLVREFVEACRARGLKVGFYYCFPGDYVNYPGIGRPIPPGKPNILGLPPEAAGNVVAFIKKQMTELLTGYGPIDLIWADQYAVKLAPAEWQEIKAHIRKLQPNCLVLGNNASSFKDSDLLSYELPIATRPFPKAGNQHPGEVCDTFDSRGWFWKGPAKPEHLKSAREVVETLKKCNDRRSNYLLDVPPDTDGLISGLHLERMKEIGRLLREQPAETR